MRQPSVLRAAAIRISGLMLDAGALPGPRGAGVSFGCAFQLEAMTERGLGVAPPPPPSSDNVRPHAPVP